MKCPGKRTIKTTINQEKDEKIVMIVEFEQSYSSNDERDINKNDERDINVEKVGNSNCKKNFRLKLFGFLVRCADNYLQNKKFWGILFRIFEFFIERDPLKVKFKKLMNYLLHWFK